ncbi:hypothetical protein EMGR_007898 [Emarellia grisea]
MVPSMRTGLNAATTPFGVEDVCDLNQVALDKRREVYDSANAKGDVLSGLQGAETVCGITTSQSTNETLEDSKGMKIRSYKEPLGVVAAVFPFTPHELTAMISFLGGYRAGEYVYTHGCATGKRVQANLGVMNHAANDLIQIKRDLYFGLGSEAGAIENGSFRACSIFYHGASEPLSSDAISDGRRTQELSDDCVRDLTALVNRTAQGELMPQNDHDLSNVCKKLVEATAGDRPTACQNYNLGELHFQAFTNQNISSASGNGDCPNSDGDYRLTLVDSNGFVNANGSSNLKNMVLGATPIVTVFYPESNLSQPDIQYVAVKPEDTSGLLGQVSGSLASGFTAPTVFALGTLVITSAFLSGII